MEPTAVLDWAHYKAVGLSDHRASVTQVSLSSLGDGWIEYPATPFKPFSPINIERLQAANKEDLRNKITKWKSHLPNQIAAVLLGNAPAAPQGPQGAESLAPEVYGHLLELCADIPRLITATDKHRHSGQIYKTAEAGQAQHVVVWLRRYRCALCYMKDARSRGLRNFEKLMRTTIRRTYRDFVSDPYLCSNLADLHPLLARTNWTVDAWQNAWNKASALQQTWSHMLNAALLSAKHAWQSHRREQAYSKPANSRERRKLHFHHKNAAASLPSIMNSPRTPLYLSQDLKSMSCGALVPPQRDLTLCHLIVPKT